MATAVSDKEGEQLVFPTCGGRIAPFNSVENEERCQTSGGLHYLASFLSLLIMTL